MRLNVTLLVGINAVLLGTTAVSAADLVIETPIVEEAASTFVLTVGAGIAAYNLPDFDAPSVFTGPTGGPLAPLDLGVDGLALGGLVGVSASTQIGAGDGYVTSLGMSGFVSFASRSSSSTVELEDDSVLFIPGITTPTGTIALTTDPAVPDAAADISGTTDVDANVTAPANAAGAINGYAVTPSAGDGFSYAGASTFADPGGNLAYAFGAIADETGGVFLAVGDLEGWEVNTDVTHDLLYAGADITFALSTAPGTGEVSVTGYVGPSYRFLGQDITTEISVDVAEIQPTAPADFAYPTYTQTTDETLATHYLGAVIGGSIAVPVGDTSSLSLGLEGGVYATNTEYDATETYAVSGGVPLPVDESVENGIEVGDSDDGFAYALRSQATFTTAISDTMQFSLGLGGEYLSQVATVGRDPAAITGPTFPGADDASYTGPDADTGSFISYGDMWSVTLTGSITGQF